MRKYKFSLITLAILVVTSFFPFLQIMILTYNGGLLGLLTNGDTNVITLIDGIVSLLMLFLFYFSNCFISKLLSALGVIFFLFPCIYFATPPVYDDYLSAFVQLPLLGLATGATLLVIEILKYKSQGQKMKRTTKRRYLFGNKTGENLGD